MKHVGTWAVAERYIVMGRQKEKETRHSVDG